MKKILGVLIALVMVLGFSVQAHATLFVRGTDTLVNQLIYDNDLDITWYDYSNTHGIWQSQVDWADALNVDFGGTIYDDWRLPVSDTCVDYDCSGSEMGHLYYTELGNTAGGPLDTSFTDGLTGNLESFLNIAIDRTYWSGTSSDVFARAFAWRFSFVDGSQDVTSLSVIRSALAVRSGDVSAVPEPSTLLLLGSGLAGLALVRRRFKA